MQYSRLRRIWIGCMTFQGSGAAWLRGWVAVDEKWWQHDPLGPGRSRKTANKYKIMQTNTHRLIVAWYNLIKLNLLANCHSGCSEVKDCAQTTKFCSLFKTFKGQGIILARLRIKASKASFKAFKVLCLTLWGVCLVHAKANRRPMQT